MQTLYLLLQVIKVAEFGLHILADWSCLESLIGASFWIGT